MKTKLLLVAACLVAVTVGSVFAVTTLTHTGLTPTSPTTPPILVLNTGYRYTSGYNFTSNVNLTLYLSNPSPNKVELVSYMVTNANGQSCVGNSAFQWDYNWWDPFVGMHTSLGTDCSYTGQAFVFSPGTYTVIVYARWEWETPAQAVAALTTEVHYS